MPKTFRLSIRELLLLMTIAALLAALYRVTAVENKPVYLHVFGTAVSSTHDFDRPTGSPANSEGRPWTRVATVHVYDRRPFGMFTPNNRSPAVGIEGKLHKTRDDTYQGQVHFWLDDSNLTYDIRESVDLTLEHVIYIDHFFDCYVLSRSEDPYQALADAIVQEASLKQNGG